MIKSFTNFSHHVKHAEEFGVISNGVIFHILYEFRQDFSFSVFLL